MFYINYRTLGLIFTVAVTALAARLPIIYGLQVFAGDSVTYVKVAENILFNGCVSYSPPAGGMCVPHQGGHFPGITSIVAAVWFVFGKSYTAALFTQAVISAAAFSRLTYAVFTLTNSRKLALLAGIVLSVSPIYLGLSSTFRTDGFSVASSAWVLAEFMLCWHYQQIRIWWVAASLVFAVFVRLDGILLCLFVPLLAIRLHPLRSAVIRTAIIAILVVTPLAGWMVRNVAAGLAPVLTSMAVDGSPMPPGYMAWINTFVTNQPETWKWVHLATEYQYDRLDIEAPVFIDGEEQKRFVQLRDRLVPAHVGQPMPQSVDREFMELAQRREKLQGPFHDLGILGKRAFSLWYGEPRYVYYWPVIIYDVTWEAIRAAKSGDFAKLTTVTIGQWVKLGVTGAITLYRWALPLVFFVLFFKFWRMPTPISLLYWCTLVLAATKTFIIALGPIINVRYVVAVYPFMEMAIILGVAHLWAMRRAMVSQRDCMPEAM